ncbi:glycosyltransferase family 1 protein [Poseidonibacter lekithochrous]|uniref:glycosyltransferase family 1 protein n=1 Tax=Poseidonibacter lekithochrous TaxID=1904463 RepID=UPI0008FC6DA4|nr:glycosyltransferase family 1 protein [Poseidonibacter lekithochrous]QKJ22282.1 glycosyltransferase, family 1 [Poseidonibacter lekithochrous]
MNVKKIVIFGKLPPPIGGVTRSIENLFRSLELKKIFVEIISKKNFFKRFDVAHVHYSKSWKRLIGLILGKIIAKKVIFTLHGNKYNNDIYNKINSKIADGVIFLNKNTYNKNHQKFTNSVILTSLFKEGLFIHKEGKKLLIKDSSKVYVLVYAYTKVIQDNKDIYGMDFILNNVDKFDDNYVIVFIDPNSGYKNDIPSNLNGKLIYLNYEVNFLSLLQEVDMYIRPTSTDGNSVAVQEALMLGKKVLASDVVDRGDSVITYKYNNSEDFFNKLKKNCDSKIDYNPNSIDKYLEFLGKL